MKKRLLNLCWLLLAAVQLTAQTIPSSRTTDWSRAGLTDTIPSYNNIINILNYGGDATGVAANDTAYLDALVALNGSPGVIYFPAGTYLFNQTMDVPDSTVIRGAGRDSAKLKFDLGGTAFQPMINVAGDLDAFSSYDVAQPAAKDDTTLVLANITGLNAGEWLLLYGNDSSLVNDAWAYGTVGQIFMVKNVIGDTVVLDRKLRRYYPLSFAAKLKRVHPATGAGIECLYLERVDSTATQTTNISIANAANCWVTGIESNLTNFAHIGVTSSANILIRGNYLHHSHGYGGGGQGYGVVLQYTSGDCLVENNVFEFLRHSMLLQAGANGNVLGYNYSKDPNWTEPSFPTNAAGDAVLHGNYPYLNLFEGNVVQNIIVDNSHYINGPFNTFFRNRAQLYGIFQNTGVGATDSVNYVGNEVTNNSTGFYSLGGTGHFEHGNAVKGVITPAGTSQLPEKSLYLLSTPGFWEPHLAWPHIGTPYLYNQGANTAQLNATNGAFTDCRHNPAYVGIAEPTRQLTVRVYPNPATECVVFDVGSYSGTVDITITDMTGRVRLVRHANAHSRIEVWTGDLPAGAYLYRLQGAAGIFTGKLLIR